MASLTAKQRDTNGRRRKAMDTPTSVPPEMTPIQEALDKYNTLLGYKTSEKHGYTIIHCGVSGGGEAEDRKYLADPKLRARIQRGLFFIFNKNGELVMVTHVCPKFYGQEDDGKMGLDASGFAPKVLLLGFEDMDLAATTEVYLYKKENGKCGHLRFVKDPVHGTMVFLASKTAPTMFPLSLLDAAAFGKDEVTNPASGLLAKMFQALVRMWKTIPAEGRTAMVSASVDDNITFLMEFCDGMHMVPLPHGQLPKFVITMMIEVAQSLDTSSSHVCHNVDGMHFTDWLRTECLVPDEHIVRFIKRDIATWNSETVNQFGTTNFFSETDEGLENSIEGYVIHYCLPVVKDGVSEVEVMAIVKGKYDEYIVLRSVREICKRSGLTPEMAVEAITKKLTGEHAYPAGHSDKEVRAVALLVECFVRWLLKYTAEKKTTPRAILHFGDSDTADPSADNPLGMGNVWRRFMEESAKSPLGRGYRIQHCFDPMHCDELIETLGRYNAAASASASGMLQPATSDVNAQIWAVVKGHVLQYLLRAGRNRDRCTKGNVSALGVSLKLTEYPADARHGERMPTFIIMRAVPGSGKTSSVKAAAELLTETLGPGCVTVASADHFWETREFQPRLLGEAHRQCRMNAFTAKTRFVIIDNTNCDLADSYPYVKFAADSGYNVVFWSIDMLGGRADCAALAARGLHLKDVKKVQQYYDKMHATPVPPTWTEYFEHPHIKNSRVDRCHGACIDVNVPSDLREKVPGSKDDGHVTLGYRKLYHSFYHPEWRSIPVTFTKVFIRADPNGKDSIACAAVELPAEYMALCATTCQSNLHVTLFANGKYEARQSADLVSGALASTQVIDISADNIVVNGQISNF
jgi:hypothetical protein